MAYIYKSKEKIKCFFASLNDYSFSLSGNKILLVFILFSGFSNTPGYLHSLITVPALVASFFFLFCMRYFIKGAWLTDLFLLSIFGVSMFLCILFYFHDAWYTKSIMYLLAHLWFLAFIFSIFLVSHHEIIKIDSFIYILALIPSMIFIPFEATAPFYGLDLGSYLPRVERPDYQFNSGLGFFRVRAFAYESAYFAMWLNVVFSILMLKIKRFRLDIMIVWITCLALTVSVFQIIMFFIVSFVFLILSLSAFLRRGSYYSKLDLKGFMQAKILFVLAGLSIMLLVIDWLFVWSWIQALFDWIWQNLEGKTPSAIRRIELAHYGLELMKSNNLFGCGFGCVQLSGVDGLSSFYLAIIVQLGLGSIIFFSLITYIFWLFLRTGEFWLIASFIFGFSHLLIIDGFYLPAVFLPMIALVEYRQNLDHKGRFH